MRQRPFITATRTLAPTRKIKRSCCRRCLLLLSLSRRQCRRAACTRFAQLPYNQSGQTWQGAAAALVLLSMSPDVALGMGLRLDAALAQANFDKEA